MAQINGRQCKGSLKIALQMCVCFWVHVCVPSWKQWCVWWYLSHSSSVQDIISQSPGLMGKDEWWELHLPVEMRLGGIDDACLLMQAGLLWPWLPPPPQHLRPRRRCHAAAGAAAAAAALVVSGLRAAVCFMMNQICRKSDSFGRA